MLTEFYRGLFAVSTIVCLWATAGCASTSERPESDGVPSACERVFAGELAGTGEHVVVLTDATASAGRITLDEEANQVISSAAESVGTLSVLVIDGEGVPPTWILRDAPLNDPGLAPDTGAFQRIVQMMPGCVESVMRTAAPVGEGSDILGAMQLAGLTLTGTGTLIVATDGLANSGLLSFEKQPYPAEPANIAEALSGMSQLPQLSGVDVHMTVGQVAGAPLNQAVLAWMTEVYSEICDSAGASSCSVRPAIAVDSEIRSGLPNDPMVPLPTLAAPTVLGEACVFTISSDIVFGEGSAALDASADLIFSEFIAKVGGAGVEVSVQGHASSTGDAAFNDQLSADRSDAVLERLVALGFPRDSLSSQGFGSRLPKDPSAPEDPVNRRVELVVTGLPSCG